MYRASAKCVAFRTHLSHFLSVFHPSSSSVYCRAGRGRASHQSGAKRWVWMCGACTLQGRCASSWQTCWPMQGPRCCQLPLLPAQEPLPTMQRTSEKQNEGDTVQVHGLPVCCLCFLFSSCECVSSAFHACCEVTVRLDAVMVCRGGCSAKVSASGLCKSPGSQNASAQRV